MRENLININWTGAPLSGEQRLVIHQLAVLFVKTRGERDWIDFTHMLVEGRLYKGRQGSLGTYSGTFFTAEMGEVSGIPWVLHFLLPHSALNGHIQEGDAFLSTTWYPDGRVDVALIDAANCEASQASHMG